MANARRPAPRRAKKPTPTWKRRVKNFFGLLLTLILLVILGGIAVVGAMFVRVQKDLPPPEEVANYQPGGITEIYATDKGPDGNNILLGRIFRQNRQFVPITQIPQSLQDATISIEDERFYTHHGVDQRGVARAIYRNFRGGKLTDGEGGSTLTQQLARNIYLTQKKTVTRKVQEMLLAVRLEQNYSKQQILEMYLNEVYYGSGAYGVQAASKVYFGKSVQKLTPAEAALIAGLPQMPSRISPFEDKKASRERRDIVLNKMAQLGYLTVDAARKAKAQDIKLVATRPVRQFDFKAPHFVHYVIKQLVDRYGEDAVYKGGLKVYTTLNWKMQQEAERALVNGVLNGRGDGVTEGALVSIEPRSGYVRAMVGGVDFKKDQWNNCVQGGRQPGSSFKVFVYTAAFDKHRLSADSEIPDDYRTYGRGRSRYVLSGSAHGMVSVRRALAHSYNRAAVYVCNEIGPKTVAEYAHKMGITSRLEPYLPLALGSSDVTPLEMASAYGTIANGGNRVAPMSIIRVMRGDGEVFDTPNEVERAVVGESAVAQIASLMQDVIEYGTASGASGIHEISNAHGKTGTTNDNKDAWFVGYTPELSTAVWVCGLQRVKKPDGTIKKKYAPMDGVTGGHVCAPIWARFMAAAIPIQRQSGLPKLPAPRGPIQEAKPPTKNADEDDGGLTMTVPALRPEPPPATAEERSAREERKDPPASNPSEVRTIAVAAGMSANVPAVSVPTPVVAPPQPVAPPKPTPAPAPAPKPTPPPVVAEAPRAVVPPVPQPVNVTICVESGRVATRWCPETITRSMVRVPRGRCTLHRPRPGDG